MGKKEPTKKSHFMDAESEAKHLENYNLTTADVILMKLTNIMYLDEFFLFIKYWGVTRRA